MQHAVRETPNPRTRVSTLPASDNTKPDPQPDYAPARIAAPMRALRSAQEGATERFTTNVRKIRAAGIIAFYASSRKISTDPLLAPLESAHAWAARPTVGKPRGRDRRGSAGAVPVR